MPTDLTQLFCVQDGSVIGRTHVLLGRNSQDAFCWRAEPNYIVAVVSDGCGSAPFSEFGARLLVNRMVSTLAHPVGMAGKTSVLPLVLYLDGLGALRKISRACRATSETESQRSFIRDHLLATIIVVVMTPDITTIASIGDGCFAVNGNYCSLDCFDSRPPYLAYGLLERNDGMPEESFRFSINAQLPTERVQSLMIGTDGVEDLVAAAERAVPGKTELVGPIDQFWSDPKYFQNPVAIDRRLHRLNREVKRLNRGTGAVETFPGLLPDDTTMVVLRRKEPA